jgi:hypothetical protein
MAREIVTRYTSDVSGQEIKETDDAKVVEIRIKFANGKGGIAVLDALTGDKLTGTVADLMKKGRMEQPRGRKPAK